MRRAYFDVTYELMDLIFGKDWADRLSFIDKLTISEKFFLPPNIRVDGIWRPPIPLVPKTVEIHLNGDGLPALCEGICPKVFLRWRVEFADGLTKTHLDGIELASHHAFPVSTYA